MSEDLPRGIAVADVGGTNTKLALFTAEGELIAERKIASRHVEGPPYRWIDPEPMARFFAGAIPELDAVLPIDVVVPCAHGAALACLDEHGALALPVMDYTQEVPPDVVADYRKIMPPFSESYCSLLPMALTHALQLYWQERAWPGDFARIRSVMPWIQYVGYRLSGRMVTEISSMSCQTHLVNVAEGGFSSLVKRQGWDRFFPPLAKAWEDIGSLKPAFRGAGLKGRGRVLAGLHDSNANLVRYLAGGFGHFTLLSTGTWSISFDTSTQIGQLREEFDTSTNTNIFGQPVATSRFFGGKEFELLTGAAGETPPDLALAMGCVRDGIYALPSFSGSAGPMPGTESRGRIAGRKPASDAELTSLASLYCALMVSEQLDAVSSRHDVIVDGPFAMNPVLLAILAQLRPGQRVLASELRDGTAAGAACLALVRDGRLPHITLKTHEVAQAGIAGLDAYRQRWREMAGAPARQG